MPLHRRGFLISRIQQLANFKGIESLRSVEWSNPILWDFMFLNTAGEYLAPFDEWFPSPDIEVDEASLESHTIQGAMRQYKIPIGFGLRTIKLTFFDDANHTLKNFFSVWINTEIGNEELFVSTLESAVKQCVVRKFSPDGTIIENSVYYVYPEGTLMWHGESDPKGPHTYVVTLIIAGESSGVSGVSKSDAEAVGQNRLVQSYDWVKKKIGV